MRRLVVVLAFVLAACGAAEVEPYAAAPVHYDAASLEMPTTTTTIPPARVGSPRAGRSRPPARVSPPGTAPEVTQPPSQAMVDGMPALLRRIGGCESSGDPNGPLRWTAVNGSGSSASGAFQILDSTWRGWRSAYGSDVGATSYARAKDAPPDVQITVATRAFNRQGPSPWNASRRCWG